MALREREATRGAEAGDGLRGDGGGRDPEEGGAPGRKGERTPFGGAPA